MNKPLALAGALRNASSLESEGRDFIGPKDIDQRHGVRGRLDLADVQLIQLFDVAEDVGKLRAEFFLLLGRQGDARQMRHIFDIEIARHGISELSILVEFAFDKRLDFVDARPGNPRLRN